MLRAGGIAVATLALAVTAALAWLAWPLGDLARRAGQGGWPLLGGGAALALLAALVALGPAGCDRWLRRALRRPPVGARRDGWLALVAAVLLLGGAVVEAAGLQALLAARDPATEAR